MTHEQLFIVLHMIDGIWYGGQPVVLKAARTMRDGLKSKWPKDEIKIELHRTYQIKKENGDYDVIEK